MEKEAGNGKSFEGRREEETRDRIPARKLSETSADPHPAEPRVINAVQVPFLLLKTNVTTDGPVRTPLRSFFYLIPGHGGGQLSHPVPPLFLQINEDVDFLAEQ